MLIDSHIHIFPEIVKNRRQNYSEDDNFRFLYENPSSKIISYDDSLLYMEHDHVDKIWALGFSWKSEKMTDIHNNYIRECSKSDERIIPFASIPSKPFKNAESYIADIKFSGFKGIGEISFYTEIFSEEQWTYIEEIFSSCLKYSLILIMHVNEPVGHYYTGKYVTDFGRLTGLIQKYPDLKIVLSHWGGGIFIYELMPEIRQAFKNVYYDTAASPYLYDQSIYKYASDITGSDKILFGTDYPLLGTGRYLEGMKKSGLTAESINNICSKNAEKLLKVSG
ncbi:MAG: amidohydrolase family protein [Spirochaetes bacterium]|nr:amidohydrolase family protein [Spirochaetota bacterium]